MSHFKLPCSFSSAFPQCFRSPHRERTLWCVVFLIKKTKVHLRDCDGGPQIRGLCVRRDQRSLSHGRSAVSSHLCGERHVEARKRDRFWAEFAEEFQRCGAGCSAQDQAQKGERRGEERGEERKFRSCGKEETLRGLQRASCEKSAQVERSFLL